MRNAHTRGLTRSRRTTMPAPLALPPDRSHPPQTHLQQDTPIKRNRERQLAHEPLPTRPRRLVLSSPPQRRGQRRALERGVGDGRAARAVARRTTSSTPQETRETQTPQADLTSITPCCQRGGLACRLCSGGVLCRTFRFRARLDAAASFWKASPLLAVLCPLCALAPVWV
ncbi:hypothetical protein GGS23DRAFT_506975 [Durotheca rogersii]|uniref:uncharacterized protein n=1 Tax=Durotheca rogersii TaxID=419775 RepID=UPI00221FDA75|nr:uncharacterized protein GGS23DRAFT_506975 [Durotheca rogersii]KAI5863620.1 hypothetical protein GGS23DRAFT_506975 [Durotheca rogersii]